MRILIGGDFTTTSRGEKAVKEKSAFSDEIVNLIKDADISILNLEAPVADVSNTKINKVGPHLRTSEETVKYLKECGIDIVTLANNHFYDYGSAGVIKTIDCLIANQIDYVGGGRNKEEYRKILYKEREGKTIALLNYCESEFSVNDEIGSNPLNPINAYYDIRAAKEKTDFILIMTHGGVEGYNLPTPRMQTLYRYFIDLGADVVVNGHQHCHSGYERYNGGLIFYGLGNLFFDKGVTRGNGWNEGFILELCIETSKNYIFKIHPYNQCLTSSASVCLLDKPSEKDFFGEMNRLNYIISDVGNLKSSFDTHCLLQKRNKMAWFTPYANRYLLALYRRKLLPSFLYGNKKLQILNMLRCESHREVCLNCLNMEGRI